MLTAERRELDGPLPLFSSFSRASIGWRVATANLRHYERIEWLTVVAPNLSA